MPAPRADRHVLDRLPGARVEDLQQLAAGGSDEETATRPIEGQAVGRLGGRHRPDDLEAGVEDDEHVAEFERGHVAGPVGRQLDPARADAVGLQVDGLDEPARGDGVDGERAIGFVGDDDVLAVGRELDAFGLEAAPDRPDHDALVEIHDGHVRGCVHLVVVALARPAGDAAPRCGRRAACRCRLVRDECQMPARAHEFRVLADVDVTQQFPARPINHRDRAALAVGQDEQLAVGRHADAARLLAARADRAGRRHRGQVDDGDVSALVAHVRDARVRACRGRNRCEQGRTQTRDKHSRQEGTERDARQWHGVSNDCRAGGSRPVRRDARGTREVNRG